MLTPPWRRRAVQVRFVNAAFTLRLHPAAMVTRTRLRAVMTALGLYTVAALIIGYFGLSAYTGAHGLKAKQDLTQQQTNLIGDIERTRAERLDLERKVSLLRADNLDPHARRARPRDAQLPAP